MGLVLLDTAYRRKDYEKRALLRQSFIVKIDRLVSVIVPPHHIVLNGEEEIFVYVLKLSYYLGNVEHAFMMPHFSRHCKMAITS